MKNRLAFIDLGTNTFHLLIADISAGKSEIVFRTKEIVGLGAGGIHENTITPEAMQRGSATLLKFKEQITLYKASRTYAFGTSALRNASNSAVFLANVKEETGIDISIINGDREAELIHLGIAGQSFITNYPYLIMDIGGGSTEFIVADRNEILWKRSFEIGVQRLLTQFVDADPPTAQTLADLYSYLNVFLGSLEEIKQFDIKAMVGASGTFTTLLDIFAHDQVKPLNDYELVPAPYFQKYYSMITRLRRQERLAIPGMSAPRVDLIVMGTCLVNYVLNLTGIEGFYVSDNGLKEGAMHLATKEKLSLFLHQL